MFGMFSGITHLSKDKTPPGQLEYNYVQQVSQLQESCISNVGSVRKPWPLKVINKGNKMYNRITFLPLILLL